MQKGTFLTVEAVEGDLVRLESGQCFAGQELLCNHVRFGSGPDPEGAGLALRRGEPALQHQAPLHGLLPGHQFGAFERFMRLPRIRGRLRGPFF